MVYCICGVGFKRDPRLEIECPTCHARVGAQCKRPSGHAGSKGFNDWHSKRKKLAFELYPCRCIELWEAAQAKKSPSSKTMKQKPTSEKAISQLEFFRLTTS